ncbi:MAG: hypothetical protein LBF71_02745 [Campylobacteraceae bacterium]|jgi:hypothetical protein|nr:hypothetical protein [Campylobacteraceae bacterium]
MYVPLAEAAYMFDIPKTRLQKLCHKDKKHGLEGRFMDDGGVTKVFVSDRITFPESDKVRSFFSLTPFFFKNEKEIAREISKRTNKSVWSEYMNIRNFSFKNPQHARVVADTISRYIRTHPLLFSIEELEK